MNQAAVVALIRQAKTPVKVILGSDDVRIEKDWPQQVKESGAEVSVIKGGTHFFNRGHEFDLVEEVESELAD
jgi:surfactin synthase thioesterase subunit